MCIQDKIYILMTLDLIIKEMRKKLNWQCLCGCLEILESLLCHCHLTGEEIVV